MTTTQGAQPRMGQCLAHLQQLLRGKGNTPADDNITPEMARHLQAIPDDLHDRILGTIFGNCIGDAIGLITEFLTKKSAADLFRSYKHFEYKMKDITAVKSYHQFRFPTADWTDDSDQMILILQSLIENNGQIVPSDFGRRILEWCKHGFPELGDKAGMGCGSTTFSVLHHRDFDTNPHLAAYNVWMERNCGAAPNGGVMRTSILGVHNYHNIQKVIENTIGICKVTHADPRCIASCIAVTTCVAMMLQGIHRSQDGSFDTQALTNDAYEYAKPYLQYYEKQENQIGIKGTVPEYPAEDLHHYMTIENIEDLNLDERGKIGYTYKCLGAGFWAFRQKDFRKAIEALTREAGDADTNGAVAGALLGCKVGYRRLPKTWREELIHKRWLEGHIQRYLGSGMMTADPDDGTDVDAAACGNASSSCVDDSATNEGVAQDAHELAKDCKTDTHDEGANNNEPAHTSDQMMSQSDAAELSHDVSHDVATEVTRTDDDSGKNVKDESNKKVKEST